MVKNDIVTFNHLTIKVDAFLSCFGVKAYSLGNLVTHICSWYCFNTFDVGFIFKK